MTRNDIYKEIYLGDGFNPIYLFEFNICAIAVYLSVRILMMLAVIGVGYIFTLTTTAAEPSTLENLGSAFVNLIYGVSAIVTLIFVLSMWVLGNVYLLRKELYEFGESVFHWDDL